MGCIYSRPKTRKNKVHPLCVEGKPVDFKNKDVGHISLPLERQTGIECLPAPKRSPEAEVLRELTEDGIIASETDDRNVAFYVPIEESPVRRPRPRLLQKIELDSERKKLRASKSLSDKLEKAAKRRSANLKDVENRARSTILRQRQVASRAELRHKKDQAIMQEKSARKVAKAVEYRRRVETERERSRRLREMKTLKRELGLSDDDEISGPGFSDSEDGFDVRPLPTDEDFYG